MTYTPINWQTGDTITAERLNRMDRGWSVGSTQLFSETVTTEAGEYGNEGSLAYVSEVAAPSITVTFDGTDYQCNAIKVNDSAVGYGGVTNAWEYDFTTYPFALVFDGGDSIFATQTAGEHTVAAAVSALQTSADFSAAVNSIVDAAINAVSQSLPLRCISGQTGFSVMADAQDDGRLMYFQHSKKTYFVHNVIQSLHGGKTAEFFPENSGMTVGFDENSVFTVTVS